MPLAAKRTRLGRGLAWVLIGVGALALADGIATLAWKEPVTAFVQGLRQNGLEERLGKVSLPAVGEVRDPRARLAASSRALARGQGEGEPLGRLEIPALGVREVMVEGTSGSSLRQGPAHYAGTALPGTRGTVGVAGHRTTHGAPFADLDDLDRGDRMSLLLPYGRFDYVVEGRRIVGARDTSVLRGAGRERLVLTACHPKWSAKERIVVFGRLARVDTRSSTST